DCCAYVVDWDDVVALLGWGWESAELDAVGHEATEQVFGLVDTCAAVAHDDSWAIDGDREAIGNGIPHNAFCNELASGISNVQLEELAIQHGPFVLWDSNTREMSGGTARGNTRP